MNYTDNRDLQDILELREAELEANRTVRREQDYKMLQLEAELEHAHCQIAVLRAELNQKDWREMHEISLDSIR